ncbi:MAG: glutaminase A [Synergistaceae bacterium]|jgi:glutaminase|nr:glutaminase A [Synergistaceae bacterium]
MMNWNAKHPTQELLVSALRSCRAQPGEGGIASYIPELASVDPSLFALSMTTMEGKSFSAGDSDYLFSMQSISKVVALAFALEHYGADCVFRYTGMEPCAEAFNSILKLETRSSIPMNPFINAGAISICSLILNRHGVNALQDVLEFISFLILREQGGKRPVLSVNQKIYESEATTADRNRSLAYFMHGSGTLACDVEETLALYFSLCSTEIHTEDLSFMGATIARGGINPATGRRVLSQDTACALLGLMATCGLYDESGEFAVRAGIPAKSGVSGGILAVVPGQMGLAVFSPGINTKGNSIAGMRALTWLSREMRLRGL